MDNSDRNFQKKHLENIFSEAPISPVFKTNKKYCTGEFESCTPYISYGDVMNFKYRIRGTKDYENKSETNPVIVEYNNIDELVNDGWRLD